MPRTRSKSSLPTPPWRYPEAADFYQEGDVVTFISARDSAEKRGTEVRSGVVVFGTGKTMAREVYIMDTTTTPKRGVPARYWRLPYVRIYTVRRQMVLIAKASFIRGDL
jgi:hypothetical protein